MKSIYSSVIAGILFLFVLTSFSLGVKQNVNEDQVKVTVLYGHPDDPEAFEDYYKNVHQPIAAKIKGVSRMEVTKFESGAPGEQPEYYRMAELYFPSIEALQSVLATPEAQATVEDLNNFATGGATMLVGNVVDFKFEQ